MDQSKVNVSGAGSGALTLFDWSLTCLAALDSGMGIAMLPSAPKTEPLHSVQQLQRNARQLMHANFQHSMQNYCSKEVALQNSNECHIGSLLLTCVELSFLARRLHKSKPSVTRQLQRAQVCCA